MKSLASAAAEFLKSNQGQDVLKKAARRHGLRPDLADDLMQEALIACHRYEHRDKVVESVEAFVSHVVRLRAVDLMRGRMNRPDGHLLRRFENDNGDEFDPLDAEADPAMVEDLVLHDIDEERLSPVMVDLRRDLARRLGKDARSAAGALAVVAIEHGGASPADDSPTPAGGVAKSEGIMWAGVFYGGYNRCFATPDDPEDPAMRQRRSRALRKLKETLQSAADGLALAMEGDDV